MTWTEGTIQLTKTIIINGGYLGIISFGLFMLSMFAITIFLSLAIGTALSSTLKDLKD